MLARAHTPARSSLCCNLAAWHLTFLKLIPRVNALAPGPTFKGITNHPRVKKGDPAHPGSKKQGRKAQQDTTTWAAAP